MGLKNKMHYNASQIYIYNNFTIKSDHTAADPTPNKPAGCAASIIYTEVEKRMHHPGNYTVQYVNT